MSAAAARRRKQLAAKAALTAAAAASSSSSSSSSSPNNQETIDPITEKMNQLLSSTNNTNTNIVIDESTAYEALQLAQSQVRKCIKQGQFQKACRTYGYDVCKILLERHRKPSVASQLLTLLAQVLTETHTVCTKEWIANIISLSSAYHEAVLGKNTSEDGDGDGDGTTTSTSGSELTSTIEQRRLLRLHSKFLKSIIGWSDLLGNVRCGALEFHELAANHAWKLSELEIQYQSTKKKNNQNNNNNNSNSNTTTTKSGSNKEEKEDEEFTPIALQSTAITHYAMAEKPDIILSKLRTLPKPSTAELKTGHTCSPSIRDSLFTRSILVMITMENIRDAHTILRGYMDTIEERTIESLKKSYMSKNDGKAPNHVIFNSMLISMVTKDKKTGPLYTWLLKGFSNSELSTMYKPEILKGYTTKIGKIYFDIQPPPGMLSTLENMMGMMGGMGGGGGGGMNPAMMQAMMSGMQGGGGGGGF